MIRSSRFRTSAAGLLYCGLLLVGCTSGRVAADGLVPLVGHCTSTAANASVVGQVAASEPVALTLALAPRDHSGLDTLLRRIYDPTDPLYGHFLTPAQFSARFSPTPEQYAAVAAFARTRGLTITGTTPNRLLLHVEAPSAAIEAAFGIHLQRLLDAHGRSFHAPDSEPKVTEDIAPLLVGIVGLDNSAVWRPHLSLEDTPNAASLVDPLQIGTGPGGGLSPADIKSAYNLAGLPATVNGAGQTLAVFELDGYKPSDVTAYENQFRTQLGVTQFPTVTPVLVDGGSGTLGSGQAEVTLDIELQIALAPGASKILVYEGPNSGQGLLDTYNQIALDDQATEISTSWGLAEDEIGSGFISAEEPIFAEMAAQGQTIYAASGDSGAEDDGQTLSVDDPASQPYITGTGGTTLARGVGGTHGSESAWGSGGGGVSALWPIPYWQQPLIGMASGASPTMRNVPDVAFDADPYTGYAISLNGGWSIYGGTSCAAPLWASFTALVNQQRSAAGKQPLGFANPLLYAIGAGLYGSYANDFYDTTSGNNGYFSAVAGYDDTTGLGTFNGAGLLADLTAGPSTGPTLTAKAGSGGVVLSWTTVPGAISYSLYRATTSGAEGSVPIQAGLTTTSFTDTNISAGTSYDYVVTAINASGVAIPSNEATVTAPLMVTISSATATPAIVTGTTSALSVQAADPQSQALTYTWVAVGTPPAPVTFSANGTASASTTTATFTKTGNYGFSVTVVDTIGRSATAAVQVSVSQTLTRLTVTPATATLTAGQTQQFAAAGTDQFGSPLPVSPAWAVSGGGAITPAGLLTAATPGGPDTVTATAPGTAAQGALTGTAQFTVAPAPAGQVRYAPRPGLEGRMVGGQFQGSNDDATWTTLATVTAAPPAGQWTTLPTSAPTANFRYLRYLAPARAYGNVAEVEFDAGSGAGAVKLVGTGIGTAGSWQNTGAVFAKALDGDLTTFFNAPDPGNNDFVGIDRGAPAPAGPAVAAAAAATPAPVTGTTAALSVLGSDPAGEAALTYTWDATGPAPVTFTPNATNAAKAATATFAAAGSYTLTVTLQDAAGLKATSTVQVTVRQTLTKLTVTPATATLTAGQTQQFAAAGTDQFGSPLPVSPAWAVSGGGAITPAGLLTAAAPGGPDTVTATAPGTAGGTVTGTAQFTVAPAPAGQVRYAPRPGLEGRMVGGQFQGSNDGVSYVTLYTVTAAPPAGRWTAVALAVDLTRYRYLRYLAPARAYGNVAEVEFDAGSGAGAVKLVGTGIGTAGSWQNTGAVFAEALDGDLTTFFNAPDPGNNDFVGIDRGAP